MNNVPCRRCGQPAPIVYRGLMAYCTACDAPRIPLASASVNLAGKSAKLGGTVARALGWVVLAGGLMLAALVFGVFALLSTVPLAATVGLIMAAASSLLAWVLLHSGKGLAAEGSSVERDARAYAIMTLAAHRGGVVRASDVAQALGLGAEEAEALLTDLVRRTPDAVTMEIDEAGGLFYRVASEHRVRVDDVGAVRVDDTAAATRTIDAEFTEGAESPSPPARHRR